MKKLKILVVDDEQLVRWFLERALKKWGHSVSTASNIAEALQLLKKTDFEVLFTDLRMPEGNGTELIEKMREIPDKHPRIVICSAFITADMAQEFKEKGMLLLKKPFKLAELEETVNLCTA